MFERELLLRELATINTDYEGMISCNSPEWDAIKNKFSTVTWDLAYVEPKREKESESNFQKRVKAQEDFKKRMYDVLRKAKLNPDEWFKNFTEITFLGRRFNNPVHIEFATHLKVVEKSLAKKYGNGDPKKAGDVLQLTKESLKGGRRESSTASVSMHTFGLAMDVNYLSNPYLGGNYQTPSYNSEKELQTFIDKLKRDLGVQDLKFRIKRNKKKYGIHEKIPLVNIILEHMGLLLYGKKEAYPTGYNYKKRMHLYIELERLNILLISYFNLNQAQINQLLSKVKPNSFWYGKNLKIATAQVDAEWQWFCGFVSRWDERDQIKAKGFLNLDRRFIDELELDWGAKYGDIMHFDMRNKCVGKKIDNARV